MPPKPKEFDRAYVIFIGRAIFGTTEDQAQQSAALAKNQGLYNGFLAAALVLGLAVRNHEAEIGAALGALAAHLERHMDVDRLLALAA